MATESMRTCSPDVGQTLPMPSAALRLCALLIFVGHASGEDEPFAKRFDTGFAKALIHAGVCTVALRQSAFTYATPYDCTTIVAAYHGQPLDDLPPEAVIARSLIARLQHDIGALVDCYDEASQAKESRYFTEYLASDQATEDDPAHMSAALIAGAFVADALYLNYRYQDRTGATKFEWFAVLKRHGRGWRLTNQTSLNDFPSSFWGACSSAMASHGSLTNDELSRMSLCRILTTPTVHAQLVQPQDLHQGDLAMAVLFSTQEPPLPLADAVDPASEAGLLALGSACRLYAGAGGDAEIAKRWLNDHPGAIRPSPFAGAVGTPRLQFCHGSVQGDACSIYLLGDGHEAIADIMMCAKDGSWKLMNESPGGATDGWLWDLTASTRLWSQIAELLRKRGE
jgi:hypothetical protein